MRRQHLLFLLLTALLLLALTAPALAAERVFKARMTAEAPAESDATGVAIFTLSEDGSTLDFTATVDGLMNVTQAHIHQGGPGQSGPFVLWLYPEGPPPVLIPGLFNGVLAQGQATAADLVGPLTGASMADLVASIEANNAYVNVHTSQFPAGEIRGQITPLDWPDINQPLLDIYGLELADLAAISDGFLDGTWRPGQSMPRMQFVKMALDAFGIPTATPAVASFTDVPTTHPFFPWIEGAKAAGLVEGVAPGKFAPELIVTREQAGAVIARQVARTLGLNLDEIFTPQEINQILAAFSDAGQVGPNLREEMAFAIHLEVILGSAGRLSPKASLTRIQGAAMLTRAARSTIALPGAQVFPEGVAFDDATERFFVGSTTDGTIFRGRLRDPEAEVFLPGGQNGRTFAVGMKVDAQGRLIIAGGPTGMVWVYNIATGAFITRFDNGLPENETFLNDLAVAPNGDVFVTDSFSPTIWRIPAADLVPSNEVETLEPWLDLEGTAIQFEEGFNLNGIVATADGQSLLTVQSNTGELFRISIGSMAVTEVDLGTLLLIGGDGLLLDGQELVVIGNGRVQVVQLSAGLASGTLVETIVDPSFATPTTGAFADGLLLVVNSQFAQQQGTPMLPFTISVIER